MRLREALASGKFVITAEVGPPKGTNVEHILEEAEHFRGRVDAVNVTDLQAAAMRLGSLATCHLLREQGHQPVLQVVCRDRNRLALQSDLLSAWVLGVENVLCLTGDYPTLGDHKGAKPVYDLDSVQLLAAAQGLNEGHDLEGNALDGAPDFLLGAVVTPGGNPVEAQVLKLEKKVAAGARFVQTQAVYELEQFARFMDRVSPLGVPILAGIVLLKSAGMARYMNNNVAGVHVPDPLIERMATTDNKVATSIEIAAELCRQLRRYCRGVHLMPLGWGQHVPAVLEAAGLS